MKTIVRKIMKRLTARLTAALSSIPGLAGTALKQIRPVSFILAFASFALVTGAAAALDDAPSREPLRKDHPAVLHSTQGDFNALFGKKQVFLDRQDLRLDSPKDSLFTGAGLLQLPFGGTKQVGILRPGTVHILTPLPDQHPEFSQAGHLLAQGFRRVDFPEFQIKQASKDGSAEVVYGCALYQKDLKKGEAFNFGRWAVPLIFPEKPLDQVPTDPSVFVKHPPAGDPVHIPGFEISGLKVPDYEHPFPVVDFNPLPQHADANRHFTEVSSITMTPGGRLWCAFVTAVLTEGIGLHVLVVYSDDDGETWSDPVIALGRPDDGVMRTDHPLAWVDPSGKFWLFFSTFPTGWAQFPPAVEWVMTCDNPDAADIRSMKWSKPRLFSINQNVFNEPTVLEDGTWIFPTLNWGNVIPSRPMISRDQGQTFEFGGALSLSGKQVVFGDDLGEDEKTVVDTEHREVPVGETLPDTKQNFDEYRIVERKDGSLIVFNRHSTSFRQYESFDQGKTWTNYKLNGIPHNAVRFEFRRLKSGNWLLIKNGDMTGPHKLRTHLMAFLSRDEGKTWEGGLMLDTRPSCYPDATEGPDGTIYCSYDGRRPEQPEVRVARFTEADVLAKRIVSEKGKLRGIINKAGGFSPQFWSMERKKMPSGGIFWLIPRRMPEDGAPLKRSPAGSFSMEGASPKAFRPNAVIFQGHGEAFRNRDYRIVECPDALKGAGFFDTNGDATVKEIHCEKPGMLYMLTPAEEANPVYSSERILLEQGFEKVAVRETFLCNVYVGSSNVGHYFTLYQKECADGETVRFANWTVPVFFNK